MEKRFVYADNAATTAPSREAIEAMMPALTDEWGNPSSLHTKGQRAKELIEQARATIADRLGAMRSEIYFTSCGTEADNWAIRGAAYANVKKGKHIITSKVEHHAVLYTCEQLEKEGFEVTYLDVDGDGRVYPEQVRDAIRPDTTLVAIMYANNEIGTIMPIEEISAVCKEKGVLFFTDAVQAVGNVPIDVHKLGVDIDLKESRVDMLSLSGHKIHAPKGIGALYIKRGIRIQNLINGGGQEAGKRSGTENVPYICALAKAIEIATDKLGEVYKIARKRDRLIDTVLKTIPNSRLNGPREGRLAGNANFSFDYIEGESMMLLLNEEGICVSTGSACSSRSLEPSHVLLAIGLPHEKAHGSLRISITHETTDEDIDYILQKLPEVVLRLRLMSPLYNG